MDVICHGQRYVVRIFFTQLLHCDEHTVVFMIHYYTELKKRIKRKIIKQLESPTYTIVIPEGEWQIVDGEDKRIKLYLDEFCRLPAYGFELLFGKIFVHLYSGRFDMVRDIFNALLVVQLCSKLNKFKI